MLMATPASHTASKVSCNRKEGQLKNLAKQQPAQKTAAFTNSAIAWKQFHNQLQLLFSPQTYTS